MNANTTDRGVVTVTPGKYHIRGMGKDIGGEEHLYSVIVAAKRGTSTFPLELTFVFDGDSIHDGSRAEAGVVENDVD